MDVLQQSRGILPTKAADPTSAPVDGRATWRAELPGLAAVFVQVVLVALVMRGAGLDPLALRRVVYLAAGGFLVNHFLPLRLRLPFFALLSLAGMVLVLGGTIDARTPDLARGLMRTGTLIGVGGLLIAVCHLSIGFWQRAGLLLLLGGIMAAFRSDFWNSGLIAVVWPVLASMFMFRVMVYLYDVSTSPTRPSVSQSAAYFFLLPNSCTLLFPVIDFRTFCQKYYDEPALVIYQRGAKWMARGVVHLLLYRAIDRLLAIDAASVANGTDVIRFVVSNMFLYLKVSGSFHLIVGLLLLFGFNLPETNRRYFLASSFTDYWRRVNIYWRNFIMKVFYYPTFFRFKHLGQTKALTLATAWSFFVTWALHLYQTWWIKGSVAWTWPDALFWAALGALVLINSLWELRRNRRRRLASGTFTTGEAFGLALRTAGTFTVISVLWSLWSTPTLTQWVHLWSLADGYTLGWGAAVLAAIMIATLGFEVLPTRWQRTQTAADRTRVSPFYRDLLLHAAPLLVAYAATHPVVQARLLNTSSPKITDVISFARVLTEKDEARGQGRGYYESLTSADQGGSQFYETVNPGRGPRYAQPTRDVPGVHFGELIPNHTFEHHGWRFATNRWGMRDRDYEQARPPGTLRLALLGSSHVMGYGLPEPEMFEPAIERRLNSEHRDHGRFEVLNFSIGGLSPIGQLWRLQDRVVQFQPDIIILVGHLNDFEWTNRDVARIVRKRLPLPSGFPMHVLTETRVESGTPEPFAIERLRRAEETILLFCYREIARLSRASDALPVYVLLPLPTEIPLNARETARLLSLARDAGFVVLDLSKVYSGHDPKQLIQNDEGRHLNKEGSALIAAELYRQLTEEPAIALLERARRALQSTSLSTTTPSAP